MIELPEGRVLTLANIDGLLFVGVAGEGENVMIVGNTIWSMTDRTIVIWDQIPEELTHAQ